MKILKKRAIACLIDAFIYGFIVELFRLIVFKMPTDPGWWVPLLILPFICRDVLFKNASIGKKIMGIAIYDNYWKSPKITLLIKRSLLVSTVGYVILLRSYGMHGDKISVIDWERDTLGTRVIDKKIFKKLSEEARTQEGDYAKNMTELYNAYLRGIYIK